MTKLTAGLFSFAIALATGACAHASSIDTFDFVQSGYVDKNQDNIVAIISGSFTGIPDATGSISLASLSGFTIEGASFKPTFFSFNENGGNSSLDVAVAPNGEPVCIGAAAAFGGTLTAVNCGPGQFNGYGVFDIPNPTAFGTQSLAAVTLVSSVPIGGSGTSGSGATVPEPGTFLLFGSGLLLSSLGLSLYRREPSLKSVAPAGVSPNTLK